MPPSPLTHGCVGSTSSPVPCGAEPCPCYPASPGDGHSGPRGAGNQSPPPGLGWQGAACPAPWRGFWGPVQRDDVVGLSFGMLSPPLAVSRFL